MSDPSPAILRAESYGDLAPLIELCKAGRLFEVQTWIAEGRPVNAPPPPEKGQRPKTPLEYAIDRGFHSLVQVLLEGGAAQEPEGHDAPMYRALQAKRFDIVQLLVEHGFDPEAVDMHRVFSSWDPKIMNFFIERGAEIRAGHPFAWALCNRIRTAVGVYKRCREQVPELQEQADIALRHHCAEGNLKWVSLMLWAGADPFTPGVDRPEEEVDEDDERWSAVGLAALLGHYEILSLKPIRSKLPGPNPAEFVRHLTRGKGVDVLKHLLEKGLDPNDQADGGCSAIGPCLESMSWDYVPNSSGGFLDGNRGARKADTARTRDHLRAIHLLVSHGAEWKPADKKEIESARRSLLKLVPDYTVEFVWIMAKHRACTLESVQELLRTPTIKAHTAGHRERLQEMLASWA